MSLRATRLTRRRLLFLTVGASAAMLAACTQQPTAPAAPAKPAEAPKPAEAAKPAAPVAPPAAAPAAGGQKYEVTFLTTQTNPADVKIYEELSKKFTDLNPNLTVKVTAEAGAGIDQKLLAYLTAGTLPDIIQTNDNFAAPYKKAGISRDMIPLAKASGFPYEDFDPTFLNLGIVDGELHMLPKQGDVIIPFVNLRMAKEASVNLPTKVEVLKDADKDKWTWEEYMAMVKTLTVDTSGKRGDQAGFDKNNVNVYGAAIQVDAWWMYVPMVLAEGGKFVSDDLTKSEINSPAGVAAFKKLTDPIKDGFWAPPTLLQTMTNSGTVFAAGKAATAPLQRLWCTTFRANLKDEFDVVHFPKGKTKRVTGMGTFGFALTTKAKNPEAAWKFLEFMYGEEGTKIMTSSYASVPARKAYYNSPFWRELPGPPFNNAVFVDAFQYGTTPPRLPFYSTGPFRQAVTDGITAITLGKSNPEEVVASIDKVLNEFLQGQKK
jgi:multiple sugar transport system substrate-binding protein